MDRRGDPHYAGNPASLPTISTDEDSSLEDSDFSATALRYINQMLMEEDMEENSCMFHDSLALQAAEKSFYDVIGEKYPSSSCSSSIQHHLHNYPIVESPEDSLSGNFSENSTSSGSSYGTTSTRNSAESQWSSVDSIEYNPSILPTTFPIAANFVFQSNSTPSTQSSTNHNSVFTTTYSGFLGTSMAGFLDSTLLSNSEYLPQFERSGVEQASKFLPKHSPFIIDPKNTTLFPSFRKAPQVVIKTENDEVEYFPSELKGRKNHEGDDEAELQHGRINKQSAAYVDDSELSELFDKVLLGTGLGKQAPRNISMQQNEESNRYGGGKSRVKKQCYNDEVVDLRTLLMLCAQAISSDNLSTANELLKQIKQHSSSMGDGTQRLAHCFGNALEARMACTGTQIYSVLSSKRTSAADMVRAYQMYASACPFEKLAIMFANNSIWSVAKEVETLHIVDFGIRHGFKWPAFIHRLSKRTGGPPKLRITGIELPQPGFRPEERVQETGRRLARYCNRFNVPFEFNAIAQKWETIKVEDLKLKENELVAVNCMFRFENLLDETVVSNNPRDAVLKLIRKANPSIFVHGIVNGCYDAPFFVTRFREALFHYSALFDMLDTNVGREDPMRLMFEKEFFGREVMNIVACEGCERVERPETYKQWQLRNMRAGFRKLPLDHQIINKLGGRLRDDAYHSDFMLEVDGSWVLQGWKGRILHASSCWVPA